MNILFFSRSKYESWPSTSAHDYWCGRHLSMCPLIAYWHNDTIPPKVPCPHHLSFSNLSPPAPPVADSSLPSPTHLTPTNRATIWSHRRPHLLRRAFFSIALVLYGIQDNCSFMHEKVLYRCTINDSASS